MDFSVISSSPAVRTTLCLALGGWAILLLHLTAVPPVSKLLLGIASLAPVLPALVPTRLRNHAEKLTLLVVWVATSLLPWALIPGRNRLTFFHGYYALITWLVAATLAISVRGATPARTGWHWKILALAWAFLGEGLWLGGAYLQNRARDFYLGLGIGVALLVFTKL